MSDRPDITPEDGAEVAEYALGLRDRAERAAFEARLAGDAGLRAELADWQERFAAMADHEVEPVAPPRRVKAGLESRLFETQKPGIWQRAGLWRGLALASLAGVAALLGVVLTEPGQQVPAGPRFVAQVTGEAGVTLAALYDPGEGALSLRRTAGAAAPGRALELWIIQGDAAPVSLGVLPQTETARLVVPQTLLAALDGSVLAISDEPPGGSPTGAPTGAVLAVGALTSL